MKKTILKKVGLIFPIFITTLLFAFGQRTIRGTVNDDSGESLIGANILIQGGCVGTVTDFDGSYSIVVPEDSITLVFSYTGYRSKEINIGTVSYTHLTLPTILLV